MATGLRRCLALIVLAFVTAAAAGCGASPGHRADPGPLPGVSGKLGADPVITIPNGNPSRQLVVRTIIPGRGAVVRPGDYVLFNVQGRVWAGDREIADSYTDRQPQSLPLRAALPAWRHLAGQRIGSRVLMVVPPRDGFGAQGNSQANVTATDTLVFVFDLLGTMPETAHASGATVPYQPGTAMPSVTWNSRGPAITAPAAVKPPGKLVRRLLIRGAGPPIQAGQTVVIQEAGAVWRTSKVFDSTWARGFPESFQLGAGQVIPGLESGLGGLPVGSRVLLVVPPSLGYGKAGDAPDVRSHDTLVFVVDILAAV
jgi:peptidylprolyl isomerase